MYLGKIIEAGRACQLFEQPQHPHMRALVPAIPTIDGRARHQRIRLDGEPVSPIGPDPHMRRFHGRCPRQTERCRLPMPPLADVAAGHLMACHYPEPLAY
jgi:oligopeptide/dipeptide ABC transporter ATP-binding protein